MESYQFIKEQRKALGLTVKEFCGKADISIGTFTECQNGTKSLLCLSFGKAVRMFSVFDIDIEKFYGDYFPELRQEMIQKLEDWRTEHPVERNFNKLRSRYRSYIAKMKERKDISDMEIKGLLRDYNGTFRELEAYVNEKGEITEELYKEKIMPLAYSLKQRQDESGIKNGFSRLIDEAILKSGMTYAELGKIVGVTPRRLTSCKTSPEGYSGMRIDSVLKICHALNIPFDEIREHC